MTATRRHGRRSSIAGATATEVFRDMQSEYRMGNPNRFVSIDLGTAAVGTSADVHTGNDRKYMRMVELARHYEINNDIIGPAIRRLVTSICRGSFGLNPKTGDKDLNAKLKSRWQAWATDKRQCDHRKRQNFYSAVKTATRRVIVDGDVLPVLTKAGAIEWMEGHRLRTPENSRKRKDPRNIPVHGVEFDRNERPARYWFTKSEVRPGRSVNNVGDCTPRDAFDRNGNPNVLHCMLPERFTGSRGVTSLCRLQDSPGQVDDLKFATLVKTQVQSCWSIFELAELGTDEDDPGSPEDGELGEQDEYYRFGDDDPRTETELAPGMYKKLRPGKKVESFAPNIQANDFKEFIFVLLNIIATNLDVPLQVLLLDPTATNFSGWRGALDQARERYSEIQQELLIEQMYQPVYEWKVRQWINEDATLRRAAENPDLQVFAHDWIRPAWPSIQPVDDATADLMQLANGMESPVTYQARRHGRDWDDFYPEVINARADAIAYAFERLTALRDAVGVKDSDFDVTWRDLMPFPLSDNIKLTLMGAGSGGDNAERN